MSDWLKGLTPKDWLFDGRPIRGRIMLARFANLDWSKAWVDMGPSIAGNPGPYWHVPLNETIIDGELYDAGDTVHRLYPKLLQTKWLPLIQRACQEVAEKHDPKKLKKEKDELTIELISARIALREAMNSRAPDYVEADHPGWVDRVKKNIRF